MIHPVKLPAGTLHELTKVVWVGWAMLDYAHSSGVKLDKPTMAQHVTRVLAGLDQDVAQYLHGLSTTDLGTAAADWAFRGNRPAILKQFATNKAPRKRPKAAPKPGTAAPKPAKAVTPRAVVVKERGDWLSAAKADQYALYRPNAQGRLTRIVTSEEDGAEPWEVALGRFLIGFYEGFSNSDPTKGLDRGLLMRAAMYNRQEFLREFRAANEGQWVCPVCDEQLWASHTGANIRGDVDHYFPKSIYPHLAMHPYNLVPTCARCNRDIKGERDPLGTTQQRTLDEVPLPYRLSVLRDDVFMTFDFAAADAGQRLTMQARTAPAARGTPLVAPTAATVGTRLAALSETYEVPQRWSQRSHRSGGAAVGPVAPGPGAQQGAGVNMPVVPAAHNLKLYAGQPATQPLNPDHPLWSSLESLLFRRATSYFRFGRINHLKATELLDILDDVAGYLSEGELGLFPDTVTLLWWVLNQGQQLAADVKNKRGGRNALLQTVNEMLVVEKRWEARRVKKGQELRKHLP